MIEADMDQQPRWSWPAKLPLADVLGAQWQGQEVTARLLVLTRQWERRRPAQSLTPAQEAGRAPLPGQWAWQDHEIYTALTFEPAEPRGDWLEVYASIEVLPSPRKFTGWLVRVDLEVACWCVTDHNVHTVQVEERLADTPDVALDQFAELLAVVDGWLEVSRDPGWWRGRHGLPQPS